MKIREANISDASGIGKVHVDSWRSTYKGIVPDEYLNNMTYEKREKLWINNISAQDQYIIVAEDETGQIVGFASGGKRVTNEHEDSGDLTSIYILEEFQGQGVGTQLMKEMFAYFRKVGYHTIFVEVLKSNESKFFYEAFEAVHNETSSITIQGKELDLLIYKWTEI
ncbi:ribosomal protein S18 acetylase RimI-like enzyme [Alkalibacillus filiformis]|uniref:Ribosomal protein S18 acetylase RimI-like enzyme n=1 Tax=Alkalibacillus filiformis TaxID=200990 RepID=A0ABU0DU37_9BACI|nr:GNAT family N-acetyltransferase [Alkalibacillus filiformis]MDQ0351942.1 ribosomal protein S18 acetylase RimI-like enzyme [Alkalibacillus filiformis]